MLLSQTGKLLELKFNKMWTYKEQTHFIPRSSSSSSTSSSRSSSSHHNCHPQQQKQTHHPLFDNGGSKCLRNVCKSVSHYTSSPHKAIIFKIITVRTSHLTTKISFLTMRNKNSQPLNRTDKIVAFIIRKQRYW